MSRRVVVLDYGSGNVRSVVRMLERVGADVELTADPRAVRRADGLYVPGVGNFHACVQGLVGVGGDTLIRERVVAGAPVLGVCVGMQAMFVDSTETSAVGTHPGLGLWSGAVTRLTGPVVPHMGWSTVEPPPGTRLLRGLGGERFYFVHSFAAHEAPVRDGARPLTTWAEHGDRFVAAVEDGPVSATQFHPEKSGDAGAQLLSGWLETL
ncbi:imidazole glycerol phosphate synthase subunit HisH [Luteipulveratus sp. YIM 133132]|uniref:imidazole glycerol phosphate synthase subunit HisH n=1 Tax=Luteipulveratus flavus TaxID=3031728 RepID=UPI0023B1D7DF|nr:imidazole glycerol phosphate synthase subunit HisH [Luteipulveratus sp. YIM 133132]MDE9367481.1 imidazole glycerol phosphate synthase subunit HisH [Luteipulveratus sp. YIM 133132]